MYIDEDLPKPKYGAKRTNIDGKRFYEIDGQQVYAPSITTVLSCRGKVSIYQWRKRVGDVVANKISTTATRSGTSLHSLCEEYLSNDKNLTIKSERHTSPEVLVRFRKFKTFLDTISKPLMIEAPLVSKTLGIGGTVDCIAEIDGKIYAVDFKTSRRHKNREDIRSYFAQVAFYAIAFREMYGIRVDGIIVAISVEGEDEPVVYYCEVMNHIAYLYESMTMYANGEID